MYFDGFLMLEKQKLIMNGVERSMMPQKIKTAEKAWSSYLNGEVALVQRKKDEGEYEYIAIKS